jgi:RNA polymerase sigma-70 factor (ECF subfamily)
MSAAPPQVDLEVAYRRYGPMVFRRCVRLLRDEEKAADCMQDVFVQLARHRDRFDGAATAALLTRIATNLSLNRLRADRIRPQCADDGVLGEILAADDLEARTLAGRTLGWLFAPERERTRTLAVLHFLDGLTYEEIAQQEGISAEGVRKHLNRFRGRIRERAEER